MNIRITITKTEQQKQNKNKHNTHRRRRVVFRVMRLILFYILLPFWLVSGLLEAAFATQCVPILRPHSARTAPERFLGRMGAGQPRPLAARTSECFLEVWVYLDCAYGSGLKVTIVRNLFARTAARPFVRPFSHALHVAQLAKNQNVRPFVHSAGRATICPVVPACAK